MSGEHNELWKKYHLHKDPQIKEELVVRNVPLVKKIAQKLSYQLPPHFLIDDLCSNGIFGLIEAVERYNPALGIPFEVYACKRIRGSILDGIRKEDWVPTSVRKKAKLIEQAYQKLESLLQRDVSDEEIAAELNISVQEFRNWLASIQYVSVISLDEPLSDEGTSPIKENLCDEVSPNPQALSEQKETKMMLIQAIGELPEKEKLVVSLFYYHDLSNKEIAQVMELSDSRVSQLHTKAILRLRARMARCNKVSIG